MEIKEKKRKKEILTERKIAILECIASGYTNEEISKEIGCSCSLIHLELRDLFKDTKTQHKAHLIAWAYRHGILS